MLPDLVVAKYRTISMIVIGLLIAGCAWVLVFLGYFSDLLFNWSDQNKSFAHDSRLLLWLLLILAQAAVWPLIVLIVVNKIREIQDYASGNWGEVVLSALLFFAGAIAVGLVAVLGPDLPNWLPGYDWKLGILSVVGVGVALAPAVGMWKAQSALRTLLEEVGDGQPQTIHFDRLLHLKDALKLFLVSLGTLLSLAVIAAAAERRAVDGFGKLDNANYDVDGVFPTHFVTLYGLLLSALVALAYAPAHVTLRAVGVSFRDKRVPLVDPGNIDAWQKRLGERQSFEDLLDLRADTASNLKTGTIALAPLLASLTGLIGN